MIQRSIVKKNEKISIKGMSIYRQKIANIDVLFHLPEKELSS
jgi:hypothetical protein